MRCSLRRALLPTAALATAGLLALPAAVSATVGHSGRVGSPPEVAAHAVPARTLQRAPQVVHRQLRNRKTQLCLANAKNLFDANGSVYTHFCSPTRKYESWHGFGEQVIHDVTGLCLDSNYGNPGNVYTTPCDPKHHNNFQNWHHVGAQFINRKTKLCLDSNSNRDVYTTPCSPGGHNDNQNWDVPRTPYP